MIRSKYIIQTLVLLLGISLLPAFRLVDDLERISSTKNLSVETTDLKAKAFAVLKSKCNYCHQTKNPRKVFTLDNMEKLAYRINKQVFIKKRMPKEGELTTSEYSDLKNWLNTLNIQ